jgi:hypothetical protein
MTIYIPYLLVILAVAGALIYALATNNKAAELGRCLFWVSLLVWLLRWAAPLR